MIVVGGGVIGCGVAYELARRSIPVTLIDKSLPGRATSASAGGLWPIGEGIGLGCGVIYHAKHDDMKAGDLNQLGLLPQAFRDFLVQSNACFPDLVPRLAELSGVDVEFESGAGLIFVIYEESEAAFVRRVADSLAGEHEIEILSAEDAWEIEPNLTRDLRGAARIAGEYQVNPMALAEAYKRSAIELGATFRQDTQVTGLCQEGDRIVGVRIGDESLGCGTVVNAAGSWAGRLAANAGIDLPIHPVRGQIVLTETLPHTLEGCLSTSQCYIVQKNHGEVLIGSTTEEAGFDVGVTSDAIGKLCRGAARAVPRLGGVGVRRVWAGLRPGTPDELPVLGPVRGLSGYVNATGGFRTGIVAAPLTARVVAQCVAGEDVEVPLEPFLLERFATRSCPSAV